MLCQSLPFDVFTEIKIQCQIVSSSLTKKEFPIIILLWSLTYIFIIEQTNKMNFNTLFKMDLNRICTFSVFRTIVQSKEMFRREFISAWQVNGRKNVGSWHRRGRQAKAQSTDFSFHFLHSPLARSCSRATLALDYSHRGNKCQKNAFSYWGISGARAHVYHLILHARWSKCQSK